MTLEQWNKIIDDLRAMPPAARLRMGGALQELIQHDVKAVAEARRGAVREMRASGWTIPALADELGVSVTRVKQLLRPRPPRTT
jgi:DNA-directed RNA polymerase specialized sigma24 family protein